VLGVNPLMNAHGYDLEEQATEVQGMLPGSRSVSSNVFLTVSVAL